MRRVDETVSSWMDGDARLTNAMLLVFGCALVWLTHQFSNEITHFWIGFENTALLSGVVYLGAVLIVRTQPVNRATIWIVVWLAVAMYCLTFLDDPFLSSDMYRYVWDGMVQHHGINPYRYVPGDAALQALRAPNQDIFDNINRRDYARTIYPPVAQIIYGVITWFAPTVDAMKLGMLTFVALGGWACGKILERMGRPVAEVLLLAWCPALVWEIGDAAHVDAVVIALVALTLLCRWRGSRGWTGFFLGCAVMVKFYPVVLFPALWQRRDWRMPAALMAVVLVGYGLYARVGMLVFGFLFTGYTKEEGMESGTRYFPLDFVRQRLHMPWMPNAAFYLLCAAALGGVTWWCWQRATVEGVPEGRGVPAFVRGAGWLGFALMLLFSPHYPWYVIWLVPFMVVMPNLPMYVYVMGLWFGLTTGLATPGPKMFLLNERLYLAVLVSFPVTWALRRWDVLGRMRSPARAALQQRV